MSSWSRTCSGASSNANASAFPTQDIIPRSRVITGSSKPLVCSVLRGGIGNRLFQIMAGLGYAERSGKQFVFVEKHINDNFHSGYRATMDMLLALFPSIKVFRGSRGTWTRYESKNCRCKDKFYDYEPIPVIGGSVILDGFFQNELYFAADYIGNFKVPKPQLAAAATALDEFIQTINFEKTYFIHFRLGDYVNTDYDVGLTMYYKECIATCSNFLIFSDEVDKLNLSDLFPPGVSYTIVPSGTGTWASLYLMSLCAGGICANSTFSWFGGLACASGLGRVFMPPRWHKVITGAPIPTWATVPQLL